MNPFKRYSSTPEAIRKAKDNELLRWKPWLKYGAPMKHLIGCLWYGPRSGRLYLNLKILNGQYSMCFYLNLRNILHMLKGGAVWHG